jgi:hypothetical protein
MPLSQSARSNERTFADDGSRSWSGWLIEMLFKSSVFVLAGAALGIAVYAFTVSYGEGARALIFFLIPSMWGAYALAVFDGQPKALQDLTAPIANSIAVVAGAAVASVLFLDTPVSIANLALGTMEAFFFVMRISNQPSQYRRVIGPDVRVWVRAFLIMTTVVCVFVAVVV